MKNIKASKHNNRINISFLMPTQFIERAFSQHRMLDENITELPIL